MQTNYDDSDKTLNKPERRINKAAIIALSAGHFWVDTYSGFIIPILPLIATKLNISLSLVGLIITISSLGSSLLQPFYGLISDFFKRRFFIFWGLILSSIFISFTGYAHKYWILALMLFLGNMGTGFYHPQASSLIGYLSKNKINKFMGLFIASGSIGYATGPLVSSFLAEHFGLNSTIYIMIPGVITAIIVYFAVPKIPFRVRPGIISNKLFNFEFFRGDLIILLMLTIIRALAILSFVVLMPFHWAKYHYTTMLIGIFIALFSIFGGISNYFGGQIANIIGRKQVLKYSFLLAMPFFFGSIYLTKYHFLSGIIFVIAGFLINSSVSVNIVMAQKSKPNHVGVVSGLVGGFCWGIASISLTPIGFFANTLGIKTVLTIISSLLIAGYFLTSKINDENPD